MADIRRIAGPADAGAHAIFFHGLNGTIDRTWGDAAKGACWLEWLSEDVGGLAIWAVGYSAPRTQWTSKADMALPDLGSMLLQSLLHERQLSGGNVALIGYSLGGLVLKAVLRAASDTKSNTDAASFLNRVERVATIATPHSGSAWARGITFAPVSWVARPSQLLKSMLPNESSLRDLNRFYREWIAHERKPVLTILEGNGYPVAGEVVVPESANPGILREIPTDETHTSIVRIASRDTLVYRAILQFLEEVPQNKLRFVSSTFSANGQQDLSRALDAVRGHFGASSYRTATLRLTSPTITALRDEDDSLGTLVANPSGDTSSQPLIDAEIERVLSRIRRGRFIAAFPREQEVPLFAERLLRGDLARGSAETRGDALAWAARFLAQKDTRPAAEEALTSSKALAESELTIVAEAFISGLDDPETALSSLSAIDSDLARSAALFVVSREEAAPKTLEWFESHPVDLDGDGKLLLLTLYLQAERWDDARRIAATEMSVAEQAPQFYLLGGIALLSAALPPELRRAALQVPLHPRTVPLASDNPAMADRRAAVAALEKFAPIARDLGCEEPADAAEDMALWLRLRDPQTTESALEVLAASTNDNSLSLRRFTLLLDYDVNLDLAAVEREIDVQFDSKPGGTPEAAMARFAMAFTKETPSAAAAYLRENRDQIYSHIDEDVVGLAEIDLLTQAGQVEEASARLATLKAQNADAQILQRAISRVDVASSGEGRSAQAIAEYEQHPTVDRLLLVVAVLNEAKDWRALSRYARILLEQTRDVPALVALVRALGELEDFEGIFECLSAHPDLRNQVFELQVHWAWSLYRSGDLGQALGVIGGLNEDDENIVALRTNIAIAGGAWDDLHSLIERIYATRTEQPPARLLRFAHLATAIRSSRAKELVEEAALRAPDDPNVLVGAYSAAIAGGWEAQADPASWFARAAELSDEEGPIQAVSLQELVERHPGWLERQERVNSELLSSNLPLFAAAKMLNRTLLEALLVAAVSNSHEPDARKRSLIPLRAGVQKEPRADVRRVAMDPTTILVLEFVGLLREVLDRLDHVVVPHDTMSWLFQDRMRLPFHQPSRIREAQKIRDELAVGHLEELRGEASVPAELVAEAGGELAELIAEARSRSRETKTHFVVRSTPVMKPGTLSGEEADLTDYEDVLRSWQDVLDALVTYGALGREEERYARAYITQQEPTRTAPAPLEGGSTLYVDSLGLGVLYNSRLLDSVVRAGFKVQVSRDAIREQNALLSVDRLADEVDQRVQSIRSTLETALQNGKVSLGASFKAPDPNLVDLAHPSLELFQLAKDVDVVVVDDRSLGRYDNVASGELLTPLLSSFELLKGLRTDGRLSEEQYQGALARLRSANACLVPVEPDELRYQLSRALSSTEEGALVEPPELRALRENIQSLRSSEFLQVGNEGPWLLNLTRSIRDVMVEQWQPSISEEIAEAKTEWLLELHDMRLWAHRMFGEFDEERVSAIYLQPILIAAANFAQPEPSLERFQAWINSVLLPLMEHEQPKHFRRLTQMAADFVEGASERDRGGAD